MAVEIVYKNLWFSAFNMSTIGGILGIGYLNSQSNTTWANDFWNYIGTSEMQFSVYFQPTRFDWSWNQQAPNLTYQDSYMYFGALDPNLSSYLRDSHSNSLLLQSNADQFWTFEFGSYRFGNNSDKAKQQDFTGFPMTFHVGFNGIGMPSVSYA